MRKSASGFTIVELLIVIVVIAILATIATVAYTGIRTRAQVAAIVAELESTEKALRIYSAMNGADWLRDDDALFDGEQNPYIVDIIAAQPEFAAIMSEAPSVGSLDSDEWFYDYDGDEFIGGCTWHNTGVNLALNNVGNPALLQAIDDAVDDGDLSCGKVHGSAGVFFYNIE